MAVLDWVTQQQKTGNLASVLSHIVVAGCSAGSIGAQIWASTILTTLKWSMAGVIPDSYAGVFPPTVQGSLI
jgi:peptidase E